jgi:hypothetical protein
MRPSQDAKGENGTTALSLQRAGRIASPIANRKSKIENPA